MKKTLIYFRVDAHRKFGLGHAFRCLNYAEGLRERLPVEPCFLMLKHSLDTGIGEYLVRAGIPYRIVSGDVDYREDFGITKKILNDDKSAVVFTDLLNPDPSDNDLNEDRELKFEPVDGYVKSLREEGLTVFSITDEIDEIKVRPDVVISAGNQFPQKYEKLNNGTKYCIGPEYYVVPQGIAEYTKLPKKISENGSKILIFFGGSDIDGFAEKCVTALSGVEELRLKVILGSAAPNAENTAERMREKGTEVYLKVPQVAPFMAEADMAITHGGNTTFELAAIGTPFITLCRRERQLRHAEYLADKGVALSLGSGFDIGEAEIRETVMMLAADRKKREAMSEAGRKMVDGRGIERIEEVLKQYIS